MASVGTVRGGGGEAIVRWPLPVGLSVMWRRSKLGGGGLEGDCPKSVALVGGVSTEGVADLLSVKICSLDAMFPRVTGLFTQSQE